PQQLTLFPYTTLFRSPLTVFQNDCALRNIQLVGQKTTQSCVSFPFHSWRAQFNLNRAVMFARDLVDLPVWNNVKTQCRHRRIVRSEEHTSELQSPDHL